mgnify:CR=1 FL=1
MLTLGSLAFASPWLLAALAVLLRAKGETPVEIATLVRTMLAFATPVPLTVTSLRWPSLE